jgi:hypothetical protein
MAKLDGVLLLLGVAYLTVAVGCSFAVGNAVFGAHLPVEPFYVSGVAICIVALVGSLLQGRSDV